MGRKRGSRFRKVADALEQLEGIEHAQQASRKGRLRKVINRTDKSKQRARNAFRQIGTFAEALEELGPHA